MRNGKRTAQWRIIRRLTPIAFFILLAASGAILPGRTDDPKTPEYAMIGHAHIDPVWRWTREEGYGEVLATFRSALDRIRDYPEVAFVASSAQFYQWVAEADPRMFSEIVQRVREGRWDIVGGWWVEADVNCPSGESLVRQGLYGQTFFQKHFGRKARIGFNPDAFGHPWTLPQILIGQELQSYFYMRPGPHEKSDIPAPIFHWQGADDSRILTFSILDSYNGGEGDIVGKCRMYDRRFAATLPAVNLYALFYGVGNHGGGPTIAAIKKIQTLGRTEFPTMRFSSLDSYVDRVKRLNPNLPVLKDELQHHARGCYSACSDVKKWNRNTEAVLLTAEKWAAVNTLLLKEPYPQAEFTSSWRKVLFNQFHDILAGSSIEAAYGDSRNDFDYARSTAGDVITRSLHRLAQKIGTADPLYPSSTPFIVFNPHSWRQTVPVEIEMERLQRTAAPALRDADGNPLPYQILPTAGVKVGSRIRIYFLADLPALGYRIYRLDFGLAAAPAPKAGVRVEANRLENEWVRVTFDPASGAVVSYFDKNAQRELLAGPAGIGVVLEDWDDTWGHRIVRYDREIGRFGQAETRVLEQGPERAGIRISTKFMNSTLTQEFMLSRHSPELLSRVNLDWREKCRVLKLAFPGVLKKGTLTYSQPYGFIERAMNGDEEPGQAWLDISGRDEGGEFGLSVINDLACGYSVRDGELRMTVLHSTAWSHHNPEVVTPQDNVHYMEQGEHEFRYLIFPHVGDWRRAQVAQRAQSFIEPVQTLLTTNHPGAWPKKDSLLSLTPSNSILTAMKLAEDGRAIIIRCVESEGRTAEGELRIGALNLSTPITLRPMEIKTYRIPLSSADAIQPVNLLEE